jgi:hypothetical protein
MSELEQEVAFSPARLFQNSPRAFVWPMFDKAMPESKRWALLKTHIDHLKTNLQEGNAMKSRNIAFLTGALICMLSTPTMPQSSKDWVDIKDEVI